MKKLVLISCFVFFFSTIGSLFSAEPETGLRVFFLGNSFTVNTHFQSEYFAKMAGFPAQTQLCAWSPGNTLSGHWAKPEYSAASEKGGLPSGNLTGWQQGLSDYTWDKLVVQPFFENQDNCIKACNNFLDFAKSHKSPDVQMIVKQIWFVRDVASYEAGRQPNSVTYFEAIADGIQAAHHGLVVPICPSGLVIKELRRLTALGLVTGVTKESEWYADPIHLSKLGNYADGMTQFITLYKVDPRKYQIPADVGPKHWYGYAINAETAAKIQEVAWNITSTYPRSGVTGGFIDQTPPTVPSDLKTTQITSANLRLDWKESTAPKSGLAFYQVFQNGEKLPVTLRTNTAVISNLVPNTKYQFTVAAMSKAGRLSEQSASQAAITKIPTVPVKGISLNPTALTLNLSIGKAVTVTILPANADNQGVVWTTSDSAIAIVDTDGTITGKGAGSAIITATALDNTDGIKSATVAVTILPNTPPMAAFTVTPAEGKAPLAVAFDGAGSSDPDPGDGIFGWDWDFGDGSAHFNGANPKHTYKKEGTYITSQIILDTHGASSVKVTKTIVVSPASLK